ncbi:MAG: DUF2116 family Zn-ribbon domain-containing protein [Clostridia bacterium]|nr:DUF2116 family Zn-ribbon domain-containing protein [Clostridia bacterium]
MDNQVFSNEQQNIQPTNTETQQTIDTVPIQETLPPVFCSKCGTQIPPNSNFCPSCGKTQKKKSKKFPIVFIAVVVFLFLKLLGSGSSSDLTSVYNSIVDSDLSIYASISSDGKSINVDTNPYNVEDYYRSQAYVLVKDINEALDLPDSVYTKMSETSALDGRISEEHGNIRVSWKYHPDNGLEIIYEVVD